MITYLCGCKTFFIHDYKSYVLAYIYVICVYLANTLISYSHIFWESKSALVRLLLLYWCCSSIFFLDKQLCQMRNHVHILACKIHIDITTYILNKYTKESMANIGLILWKYLLKNFCQKKFNVASWKHNIIFFYNYFLANCVIQFFCKSQQSECEEGMCAPPNRH